MNTEQRMLARHALGLSPAQTTTYRNRYFCTPAGTSYREWKDLVSEGLAEVEEGEERLAFFRLTKAGAEAALEPHEKLCPEDFPPEVRS